MGELHSTQTEEFPLQPWPNLLRRHNTPPADPISAQSALQLLKICPRIRWNLQNWPLDKITNLTLVLIFQLQNNLVGTIWRLLATSSSISSKALFPGRLVDFCFCHFVFAICNAKYTAGRTDCPPRRPKKVIFLLSHNTNFNKCLKNTKPYTLSSRFVLIVRNRLLKKSDLFADMTAVMYAGSTSQDEGTEVREDQREETFDTCWGTMQGRPR